MARLYKNPNQFVADAPGMVGKVLFVDSVRGSSSYDGTDPHEPKASLDDAINNCAADEGAIIYLMPNHAESVTSAGAIAFDTAGVKVVGLGKGAARPTFTFSTAVTASITITASCWLENILFVNGIDNLTNPINIAAADVVIKDCECRDDNASYHCDDFILTTAAANRLQIIDHVHQASGGNTGAQTAISIVGGNDIIIIPKHIDGDFATACIENVTTACDTLRVFGRASRLGYLRNRNSADVCVTCVATTKGHIGPHLYGRLADNAANITEAFVGADMEFFLPIEIVNLDGESSVGTNISASTDA